MRRAIVLAAFVVASCASTVPADPNAPPPAPPHLAKVAESDDGNVAEYLDADHGVRCYKTRWGDSYGISCVAVPAIER